MDFWEKRRFIYRRRCRNRICKLSIVKRGKIYIGKNAEKIMEREVTHFMKVQKNNMGKVYGALQIIFTF